MIGEDYDEDVRGPLYQYLITEKHSSKKLDRIKELLTEKFSYLKDTIGNNKRQTAYVVATLASGIAGYVLGGFIGESLYGAIEGATISGAFCITDDLARRSKKSIII